MTAEAERLADDLLDYCCANRKEAAALLRSQAAETERLKSANLILKDALSTASEDCTFLSSKRDKANTLLRQALESLAESRDDVALCLAHDEQFAGYERYDKRIAFYKEQLVKHDESIAAIKQHLGEV